MDTFVQILKVILFGIVEGITEWLPVSSTGHLILLDEFLPLDASDAFKEMFNVVIQLGAILAVVVMFWKRLFPFQWKDKTQPVVQKSILRLWGKVIIACIPAGVIGILFDDFFEAHLHTPLVIAAMLILYGIAFLIVEDRNKNRQFRIQTADEIDWKIALIIGAFQVLSLIPGTSRSGVTILGAILVGVARPAAASARTRMTTLPPSAFPCWRSASSWISSKSTASSPSAGTASRWASSSSARSSCLRRLPEFLAARNAPF